MKKKIISKDNRNSYKKDEQKRHYVNFTDIGI